MRNVRANVFRYLIVAVLFLAPFSYAAGNETSTQKTCNLTQAEEQCAENERCVQNTKDDEPRCECQRHYEMVDGHCSKITTTSSINETNAQTDSTKPNSGGSSVAAGLLIPTFLVVIGVLLYFGARRYKWLQRFRQFRQNRYGNVLVTRDDDDDDDPPIA
ncbi:uncharacterized protein LOC128892382 isoform X2 [Hylaeus anthracinus]|nr:uncharacterized protein LOC128881529 isoform X2 [Hylaeus volcanicus]XP_053988629.1 uncharacterized protein LOC128881529 isoform X2 [Hylaeus volcanicus]XP_054008731.1 uncharacterized protein LOC128892382 isoform X2 [Hylaeus anthracinus]XP_054008732.1 uncharacterized protein LOC128892382 isoform X2 [Hylaeus anthracinus]